MIYFILSIILIYTAIHLMKKHSRYTDADVNIMFIGVLGVGCVIDLTKLLIGLFTGVAGSVLLSYVITTLIYFGSAYYFHTRN